MPYLKTTEEPRLIQDGLDAFRIVMPRRRLGRLRWAGIATVVFGLGILGFFHTWLSGPLDMLSRGADTPGLVFATIFALVAIAVLLRARDRAEAALAETQLRVADLRAAADRAEAALRAAVTLGEGTAGIPDLLQGRIP